MTTARPSPTRLADVAVGQEVDPAWFCSVVPEAVSFETNYIVAWEGVDEKGNRQQWEKGHGVWRRTA